MGKYIILEDNAEALAHLYAILKAKDTNKEFLLVKCNYNQNYSYAESDEKETEKLKQYISTENIRYKFNGNPVIRIMKSAEELLASTSENDLYMADDLLIMDITLFENTDEIDEKNFSEYASVQLAEKLVEQEQLIPSNVRFYTKATSRSDPSAFTKQTNGRWYVPALRPTNFYASGAEEEVKIFISRILREGR